MIKNAFIYIFFVYSMAIFCSEHVPYVLASNKTLTQTDETTWLHFNYKKGCITVNNLILFKNNNTQKKYIDFSECYRKISIRLECDQNDIELFVAYRNENQYEQVKLYDETYISFTFLSLKYNILVAKKKNKLKSFFCCR